MDKFTKDSNFSLFREMREIIDIIKNYKSNDFSNVIESLNKTKKIFLSGEGSSRIFPAKNIIYENNKIGSDLSIFTEGASQASELNLSNYTLFVASNSGRTKECVHLMQSKKAYKQFSLTSFNDTVIGKLADEEFILNCGKENAVAATKSVIEQALFYQDLIYKYLGKTISKNDLEQLSKNIELIFTMEIDPTIVEKLSKSSMIYFAGRNNGVAEELTLKTNEIARKKTNYLEGTYALHGIEEVMDKSESIIFIEPFQGEESKIKEILEEKVGLFIMSIGGNDTLFPTIKIPRQEGFDQYLQLVAGRKLLAEIGLNLGINVDKPERARKVGNEV